MKKALFIASIGFLSAGRAIDLMPAVVIAQPPIVAQQPPATDNSMPIRTSQPPQIQIINLGAEPRQQMRLKPALNVKQTTLMTLKMGMKISASGQSSQEIKIPTSVVTMETEATKIDANGDIHYQFSYTKADVTSDSTNAPATALESMRSAVKKLVGLKGAFIMDSRGFSKGGDFIVPAGSDNNFKQIIRQMSQSIEQLSVQLPAEAVGKGAKWRLDFPLNSNGINVNNIATYELMSFQEGVAVLNIGLEQQAKPQSVNSPQLPAGSNINLQSLASQGRGESTIRLDKLMPVRSAVSMNSNSEMSVKMAGSPQESTIKTQLAMEITLDSQ
ncbi:MAG: hypothetical protein EAZ78_00930 [Oscillatoriales cyanobacterium]|nr:MAG: hypothetical protein EAZ98_23575 [Oscillatoriales cyanobacterium]TAF06873.1 MAG: hypothetical protein EAZ78_00930 [Oscillatoriales cyanobacterium]TAF68667.1 MAG: hypothetical protein EAZ59_10410 [Oscillatoriales cyanobacterium]